MRLVDESHNGTWGTWENAENGAPLPVSAEHPEIVTLTWPKSVTLSGVCLLWPGFDACEIDAFTGADDANVREAPAKSWTRVGTGRKLETWYPSQLGPNWIALDREVSTRALRVRMTAPAEAKHPHLADKIKDGRRVWLGELMALVPMREAALASIVLPKPGEEPPPIPVKFTLPEAGLVTLVIEDKAGTRVRNLVSETPFPAGENIAWWDGSDDFLRDTEAAKHGVYHIPTRPVVPGDYTVRGLWRKPLSLRYEFSIYNAGKPAWTTADNTGCWLTSHTPPTSMAFVPGSRTAEDGRSSSWAASSQRAAMVCNGCAKTAPKSAGNIGSAAHGQARRLWPSMVARMPSRIICATSVRCGKANCASLRRPKPSAISPFSKPCSATIHPEEAHGPTAGAHRRFRRR